MSICAPYIDLNQPRAPPRNHHSKQLDGGSFIGTHRSQPSDLDKVVENIRKFKIGGLLVLGGFEAFRACLTLVR